MAKIEMSEVEYMPVGTLRQKVRRLRKEVAPPAAPKKEGLLEQLPKLEAAKEAEEKVTKPAKMAPRKPRGKKVGPPAIVVEMLSQGSLPAGTAEEVKEVKEEVKKPRKARAKKVTAKAAPAVVEVEKHTEAAAHHMVKAKEAAKKAPKKIKKEVAKAADVIAVVDDKVSDAVDKAKSAPMSLFGPPGQKTQELPILKLTYTREERIAELRKRGFSEEAARKLVDKIKE
jgi:hypothetical protein